MGGLRVTGGQEVTVVRDVATGELCSSGQLPTQALVKPRGPQNRNRRCEGRVGT